MRGADPVHPHAPGLSPRRSTDADLEQPMEFFREGLQAGGLRRGDRDGP